jgi:hypothetical protein
MLICFFDIDGIIDKEFVPQGQTVNAKFYCDVLRRLREDMRRKQPGKWRTNNWILHHDNAPTYTALAVQHFLAPKTLTVIPHPPYLRDLAPCDFFLFPKMNIKLKRRRFDTVEEIQAESQKVLKTLTQKDFQDSFQSWQKHWDRCVRSQGDYFEGDGED